MKHMFDVEFATKYGVAEAVLAENIVYWSKKNAANERHFHDGRYWTYNSGRAFATLFPYISARTIDRALSHLVEEGILIKGNYNDDKMNRTLWYAVTEKGERELSQVVEFSDFAKSEVCIGQNGECISQNGECNNTSNTDNKQTDIKPKENHNPKGLCQKKGKQGFVPPTEEEVAEYISAKGYHVDPVAFVSYYEANGWYQGRTKMKSWKSAVVYWERTRKPTQEEQRKAKEEEDLKKYERWGKEFNDRKRLSETQEYNSEFL